MNTVLNVTGLTKSYGNLLAVDRLELCVPDGEIFGLLGHNGAGKSTTMECILGTSKPDAGEVRILGLDPKKERRKVFARVGVQFQETKYQDKLLVWEACETAASLYPRTQDCNELLERFHLTDKKKAVVNELSGGERQKLSVVLAMIPKPEILFLDEFTTGLDPQARRGIWKYLKELKATGVTIILTSHYMDEVEFLCDRIAIMKQGRITAAGTPSELVAKHKTKNLEDVFLKYMEKETSEEVVA
ncbi:MAG: ABC transporter ATP-binding protein [Spirochaetaceae bacterium]|nr:MAG: ABC transporter ATP-binding protein [Spirochaetaceae bacterium]